MDRGGPVSLVPRLPFQDALEMTCSCLTERLKQINKERDALLGKE